MKMNPVVHFEMPHDDGKRMAEFYTRAFGWNIEFLGEDMGNYILATTSEADSDGRPQKPGMINGGFYKKSEDQLSWYPSVVIAVDDLQKSMKHVERAGGKVVADWEIPNVGHYASVVDTEGNRIGVLETKMER